MENNTMIKNREDFKNIAKPFLDTVFETTLQNEFGDIEVRIFPAGSYGQSDFFNTSDGAIDLAYTLCNSGIDVYFGVNPRVGKRGTKKNVHYVSGFHVEVDYGKDGHKKASDHVTYDDALEAIQSFTHNPTLVNHSGGGFHCYWVFNNPVKVEDTGVSTLESINKSLLKALGGDTGTQNLDRVLRIPGTYNFKLLNNPREVTVIIDDGPKYDYDDFKGFIKTVEDKNDKSISEPVVNSIDSIDEDGSWDKSISALPVSDKIKFLIINGNDGSYASRSETDQAVITALVNKGISQSEITSIFQLNTIGDKYRAHKSPDKYLQHNIKRAKDFSDLSEKEMQDPLFISNSICKKNNKYFLNVVPFQEYMVKKHNLKYLEKENIFFQYNGMCYEYCTHESLNSMCQTELKKFRKLFKKSALTDFIHFCIGNELVESQIAQDAQKKYLTLQNGLYDLHEGRLIPHTPDIFTTNLLPYNFDANADCLRFLQFLDEIFMGEKAKIDFIQEAIGYAFYKAIPKPALFFLYGSGSNGKSVFIDTITNLIGDENASSISLNDLSKEYYLLDLFGKMINISSETPQKKYINTDIVKSVVAGDWVTGRVPYKQPMKFKPFAKHYLAMNEIPVIEDNSHGMWRRLYFIEFPRTFTEIEMDVHLTDKLRDELSGIFNWALEGYRSLREKKFIFNVSESMQRSKKNYRDQSNSAQAFMSENITNSGSDDRIPLKNTYDKYTNFCDAEGYSKPYSKNEFKKILQSAGYLVEKSSKDGNQVHIFNAKLMRPA